MKLLYTAVACLAAAVAPAMAQQQLSNPDFEGEWNPCVPYNFYLNEETQQPMAATVVAGTQPAGWVVSSVSGMVSAESGLGITEVADTVDGYNSKAAVKLTNTPNPFMATQIVPAYINLGTTWSTAMPKFDWGAGGITIENSDGGAFGGIEFTGRPKALEFYYKRSRATAPEGDENPDTYKPGEKSTVVAYLWKGHWTQKSVPVTITMVGEPIKQDMVDRDRCVLGYSLEGCQGGEVTKTDDAELIGKVIATITEDASEWTLFHADFEYVSEAAPESFNLIIAAGEYFGGAAAVGKDNSLCVDDVKLIYAEPVNPDVYPGYLSIVMNEQPIATNQAATVNITPTGEGLCQFSLPNFALGEMNVGDITVDSVKVSDIEGGNAYEGTVKGMKLMDDALVADVTLKGTIVDNKADFNIDVLWTNTGADPIPVKVRFTTDPQTGITAIEAEAEGQAEYFNLQGARVAGELAPGLYIRRCGNKAEKVIIR